MENIGYELIACSDVRDPGFVTMPLFGTVYLRVLVVATLAQLYKAQYFNVRGSSRLQATTSFHEPTMSRGSRSGNTNVDTDDSLTLDALQDTSGKPKYPYRVTMRLAIQTYGPLTLDQLYEVMMAKFPYYKRNTTWKVRVPVSSHNARLTTCRVLSGTCSAYGLSL